MFSWIKKVKATIEPPKVRDEIEILLTLVRLDKDWVKARHTWFHPTGVNIWIGNSDLGYSVLFGSKDPHDYSALCDTKGIRLTPYECEKLNEAFKKAKHVDQQEAVQEVALRIIKMYGDDFE